MTKVATMKTALGALTLCFKCQQMSAAYRRCCCHCEVGSMVPWAIAKDTMQFQDDELSYALGKQVMGTWRVHLMLCSLCSH